MPQHREILPGENHIPYDFEYADAAARTGAVGFLAEDVGKFARQLDDHSIWELTDESPVTWVPIGGGAASSAASTSYDDSSSGLGASNVQDAIEALDIVLDDLLQDFSGFDAYDSVGGTNVDAGWTDVPLDTERREDPDYTHNGSDAFVTFNAEGPYVIVARVSTMNVLPSSTITARTSSEMRIQADTGSGFNTVLGSQAAMYNREGLSGNGVGSSSVAVILDLTVGDQIKVQAQKIAGTGSGVIDLWPNGSALTIFKLRGAKGDQGIPGSGSSLAIENSGALLPNTPHTALDFLGLDLVSADVGGGTASVVIDQTQIDHANLQNIGINTHTQIDSHVNGSIGTHVDVDVTTITPGEGHCLGFDGSDWVPAFYPFALSCSRNALATNIWLNVTDRVPVNTSPYRIPFAAKLIAISATTQTIETWDCEVYKNTDVRSGGIPTDTNKIAELVLTASLGDETQVNVDVGAGDELGVFCRGSSIARPHVTLFLVRRL